MRGKLPWYENVVIPALLRHARSTYGHAMRQALSEAGFGDIPKNGLYIMGGLALGAGNAPLGVLVKELGVSKQAAGQLVGTLVLRGYLESMVDPADRRKLTVTLTSRGREAASAQAAARERIDAARIARVGLDDLRRTRRTLAALSDIGRNEQRDAVGG